MRRRVPAGPAASAAVLLASPPTLPVQWPPPLPSIFTSCCPCRIVFMCSPEESRGFIPWDDMKGAAVDKSDFNWWAELMWLVVPWQCSRQVSGRCLLVPAQLCIMWQTLPLPCRQVRHLLRSANSCLAVPCPADTTGGCISSHLPFFSRQVRHLQPPAPHGRQGAGRPPAGKHAPHACTVGSSSWLPF